MLLLAIDTATPATTVALHDGVTTVAARTEVDARRHAEVLAPSIDEVLRAAGARPADLTHVACGVGPGPYTGLRVGLVTARVLAAALGIPAIGVCSLDVIAAEARTAVRGALVVATDARRREVYWAEYDPDGVRRRGPRVGRPADVAASVPGATPVGEGALLHADVFLDPREPRHPDAGALAALVTARLAAGDPLPAASAVVPEDDAYGDGSTALAAAAPVLLPAVPLYLRRPDAVPPRAPKRVTS